MSAIRDHLEAKAALPEGEWLRREPRDTHPDILAAVRAFEAGGGVYDDDAERFVEERAGDLPAHFYHGHASRDRLTDQLGHEVYVARRILDDEEAAAKLAELLADGFVPFDPAAVEDGGRYVIRGGVTYVGHTVPTFGEPRELRAVRTRDGWLFMPKGARTRGYLIQAPALIRAAS